MRNKSEIELMLEFISDTVPMTACGETVQMAYTQALEWVLGKREELEI